MLAKLRSSCCSMSYKICKIQLKSLLVHFPGSFWEPCPGQLASFRPEFYYCYRLNSISENDRGSPGGKWTLMMRCQSLDNISRPTFKARMINWVIFKDRSLITLQMTLGFSHMCDKNEARRKIRVIWISKIQLFHGDIFHMIDIWYA